MVVETPNNLVYDCGLLGLYDDSSVAETPDKLGYDFGLLGLYDDSRLVETNLRHESNFTGPVR
jgi:hypothetical protein